MWVLIMKRTLTAASLAITLTSAMIGTQVDAQSVSIKYGFYNCASWAEIRNGDYTSIAPEHWLVGYLDGLAVGSGKDIWGPSQGNITDKQVFFWMDRNCANNPFDSLPVAAFKLMTDLFGKGWNVD